MNADILLESVADVLEKTAAYYESIEAEKIAKVQVQQRDETKKLVEKVSEVIGEPLDEKTAEKLAALTPEVRDLLLKMAGHSDNVDSLGGPEKQVKVAGADALPTEDLRFINWLNS
jgi:hypothetical protein